MKEIKQIPTSGIIPFWVSTYREINEARMNHLATIDIDYTGKTLLDVGCGPGDLTGFFVDRGAQVTVTDARMELVQFAKKRWKCRGFVKNASKGFKQYYDVVFAYGVLYHLKNPKQFIDSLKCDTLLLSTIVCTEGEWNLRFENDGDTTQSFERGGCIPNWHFLKDYLESKFKTVTIPKNRPDNIMFQPFPESISVEDQRLLRQVFICQNS